jgi:SSS family solute:Na+ symporter
MNSLATFPLEPLDYAAFVGYLLALTAIGVWSGRGEQASTSDYFLAGKKLPWYVVGGSFIASNISSEHFIGMIGAAAVFGICVSMSEWVNAVTFSLLIWIFIPFLLASKVFTTPEFLERRFNSALRQMFAVVTIISNVVAFLAAVLYGGGLALHHLFGWNLWVAVIVLGIVSGIWAIYGGLSSVAWTDLLSLMVMIGGGVAVTMFGLWALAGEGGTLWQGITVMLERNQAQSGEWARAVQQNTFNLAGTDSYNRLSVFQPSTHPIVPAISLLTSIFSISIWYNVLNQFMIQRVLGAKDSYHARMGIVMAGGLKVLMPLITVVPGLILFAMHPEILLIEPWAEVKPQADRAYVYMLQTLVPAGLRGLFLVALFGAIQSTVNSVLNSTATVFTLDIYQRMLRPQATQQQLVRVGVLSSIAILAIAIGLGGMVGRMGGSLFEYIQSLYAFFAPPFAAVFLLGILWRRINATGATTAVVLGFAFGIGMKVYIGLGTNHPDWLVPYANQAGLNWLLCSVVCVGVSLATAPPNPDQVTDQLTLNWSKLNVFNDLGSRWYTSVVTWWLVFVLATALLLAIFSGLVFPVSNSG